MDRGNVPIWLFISFFKAKIAGQAIGIYGDGKQTRDFTFISDAVAANLAAAVVPEAVGEVFNIGGGSVQWFCWMSWILWKKSSVNQIERSHQGLARGDARHTAADVTKARTILGYNPQVSLAEGLAQEWQWIQELYC
jgi:nucleoside-diphosphate-sugar epimerase